MNNATTDSHFLALMLGEFDMALTFLDMGDVRNAELCLVCAQRTLDRLNAANLPMTDEEDTLNTLDIFCAVQVRVIKAGKSHQNKSA